MSARIVAIIISIILVVCTVHNVVSNNEKRNKKVSSIISCIGILACLVTTIFPEKVAEYIDPNVETYREKIEELEASNNTLTESNDSLQEKYNELTSQYDKLNDAYEELESENADLKTKTNTETVETPNSDQKIAFEKVQNVLYDGSDYKCYSGNDKFIVGGIEHRNGFTIGCDRSIVNFGPGYTLFNLDGKYSKMICDVGRVDGPKGDATVIASSEDGIVNQTYEVSGSIPSQSIEINLNYAGDLRITLDADSTLDYGFFDIYFYE